MQHQSVVVNCGEIGTTHANSKRLCSAELTLAPAERASSLLQCKT